jgi:hypothetical protein
MKGRNSNLIHVVSNSLLAFGGELCSQIGFLKFYPVKVKYPVFTFFEVHRWKQKSNTAKLIPVGLRTTSYANSDYAGSSYADFKHSRTVSYDVKIHLEIIQNILFVETLI